MILRFRKSSYSTSYDNCVEVADIVPDFRKSSYSTSQDNCVEVADTSVHGAAVRDSTHPELGYIPFTATEWTAFLHRVRTEHH